MIYINKLNLPKMEEETKIYINKVLQYLDESGKFNIVDSGALNMLVNSYNTYVKASKILEEDGLIFVSDRNNKSIHPAYNIMKSSISQAMDILRDFGLSLSSRSKIKNIEAGDDSPIMDLLKNN